MFFFCVFVFLYCMASMKPAVDSIVGVDRMNSQSSNVRCLGLLQVRCPYHAASHFIIKALA